MTPAYLDWRYGRCPAAAYGTISTAEEALLVYRVRSRMGLRELTLCEAFFERSRRGLSALRADVTRLLREQAPDYAIASGRFDAAECVAMGSAGFVPLPDAGPILTTRPMNDAPVDPKAQSSWAS